MLIDPTGSQRAAQNRSRMERRSAQLDESPFSSSESSSSNSFEELGVPG
jgi:hypothetical protein